MDAARQSRDSEHESISQQAKAIRRARVCHCRLMSLTVVVLFFRASRGRAVHDERAANVSSKSIELQPHVDSSSVCAVCGPRRTPGSTW